MVSVFCLRFIMVGFRDRLVFRWNGSNLGKGSAGLDEFRAERSALVEVQRRAGYAGVQITLSVVRTESLAVTETKAAAMCGTSPWSARQ